MNLSLRPGGADGWPDLMLAFAAALAVTFLAGPSWLTAFGLADLVWVIHRSREDASHCLPCLEPSWHRLTAAWSRSNPPTIPMRNAMPCASAC